MENNVETLTIVEPHAVPHGQLENDVKAKGALAPSATLLSHSAISEDDFDIKLLVAKIAQGKLKAGGMIRERCNLNATKLVNSTVAAYRNEFTAIYRPGQQLPSKVYERIQDEVGVWITTKLATTITKENSVSTRRSFVFRKPRLEDIKDGPDTETPRWMEKVVQEGENRVSLREQRFACNLEIGRINKRLKDLEAKPNPDHDLERKYKERLTTQELTLTYLDSQLALEVK
jgi:hypothetical protein